MQADRTQDFIWRVIMEWQTPKTNWKVSSGSTYTGDYFNVSDYNRIKNNLICLTELADKLYVGLSPEGTLLEANKTFNDIYFADDFNQMETRLQSLNEQTVKQDYGTSETFYQNGAFITYDELNRIESSCLDMYTRFSNQSNGLRMMAFTLGLSVSAIRE